MQHSRDKPALSAREVLTLHLIGEMQHKSETERFQIIRELISHIEPMKIKKLYLKYIKDE